MQRTDGRDGGMPEKVHRAMRILLRVRMDVERGTVVLVRSFTCLLSDVLAHATRVDQCFCPPPYSYAAVKTHTYLTGK